MDYDYAYQAYNDDPTRSGPTGIPDPSNPGYDTAGYPLDNSTAPGAEYPSGTPGDPNTYPAPQPQSPGAPPPVPDGSAGAARQRTIGPATTQGPGAPAQQTDTAGGAPPPPAPVNLGGGALAPYAEPAPNIPNIPAYKGSQFTKPTMEEALNDPGARARWQRGQESLQNWAAARGTLNDTDTAKMLLDYGQNSEAQDYGNVYARDFGTWQANENQAQQQYGINRQTQYIDPWTAAYNEWVSKGNFYLNNQGTVANTALGFARL